MSGFIELTDYNKINNIFISNLFKLNNGGCSLVAEREPVALEARVRFSPSTLSFFQKENTQENKEKWQKQ